MIPPIEDVGGSDNIPERELGFSRIAISIPPEEMDGYLNGRDYEIEGSLSNLCNPVSEIDSFMTFVPEGENYLLISILPNDYAPLSRGEVDNPRIPNQNIVGILISTERSYNFRRNPNYSPI